MAEIEGNGGKVSKALSAHLEDFKRPVRSGQRPGRHPRAGTDHQKAVGAIFEDWAKDNSAFLSDARVPGNRVRKSNSIILDGVSSLASIQPSSSFATTGSRRRTRTFRRPSQLFRNATRFAPVFATPT